MSKQHQKTQVRVPVELHKWLTMRAQQHNRSMNGELVDILEKTKEAEQTYYTACMESGIEPIIKTEK